MESTDVLICGAGAAGLTLAIDLARRDVDFRLIDAALQPFHGSRGKGVQPRTLEVFEDLGIVDRLVAAGGPYPPQRVHRDGGFEDSPFMEISDPTPCEPYRIPLMLPQHKTEAILRERLAELGHRPLYGHALESFTQDDGGVTAVVKGMPLRARYLVGCDGGRSTVRQVLGVGFPGETLGVRALVADLDLDGLSRDAWHRWNDGKPEGMSLCPLMGTDQFQLQARIPGDGEVDLSAQGLEAMIAARTRRNDLKVHAVSWASAYSMNARLADRYQVGRVFLAGDAAHTHPPTGGQGLNTSVQDSYNLGWKLAAALGGATDLLPTYEEERRPIAAGMLGLATRLLQATRTGGGNRRGRAEQQLDLGYPDSRLAHGPNAGNRAPDAPVCGAAGQPTRLFNLLQGTHWTLLVYEAPSPVAARRGLRIHRIGHDIVDDQALVREHYGMTTGDCVLVRPDGYIGAVERHAAALERYLVSVGLRPSPDR
ncbi:MAG TPA: FAD-dependent oxidoreductase [Reyranella sp.]|nr:FAD-dependent oxidoreductase [Reyranella sp.]